ncbi:MAG: fibronectin type III domain-containing protein, partial [Crocinitomix sp.]|nr:fibronectin type III domain-containing protein [Crocinitomix sp.]
MKNFVRNTLLLLVFLMQGVVRAQIYPVQTFVQVTPPYNSYLPDYADPFTNQLRVLLTLTDFSVPSTQVKLRFSIEGSGYTLQSVNLIAFPIITLTPGVPVEISGSDLAPYLSTSNLVFSGLNPATYELSKILPEGPASICVEVVDVTSANQPVVGNPACAQTWFSLYDPPLLNTPFCGSEITPTDPQGILFSWTPLHMASPLSGSTEYEFELFEIRPNEGDPNVVVNSTLPIFSQTTTSTFLNYGIIEPPLQAGMSYVWRVKAKDPSLRNLYRNNGYSAVCTFTYGSIAGSLIAGIVLELNSNGTGVRQGLTWWNASDLFDSYTLELRKTGNPAYEWFPYTATEGNLKVNSLEPLTQYECRVKGIAGGAETEWSNTSTFTTQAQPNYACGSTVLPASSPIIKPLDYLLISNIVSVGQFEMVVTAAEPLALAGHFAGTGKINVPFIGLNLHVIYEDIFIDEDMVMRSGRVDVITDGIDAWLDDQAVIFIDGIINQSGGFEFNDDSTVTVFFGDQSLTFEFIEGQPLVFEDESGLIYTVYSDGRIEISGEITWDDDVLAGTANHQIRFEALADQSFGFDKKTYLQWTRLYPCIRLSDNSLYFVSYKSVGASESDQLVAYITSEETINTPTFKYEDGTVLSSEKINDTTYHVTVGNTNNSKFIYGYDDQGAKIGKSILSVYEPLTRDIVLVPVNGSEVPADIESYLNATFQQANVQFNVTQAPNYENELYDVTADGLDAPDATLMQKYSTEMRTLRDAYFAANPANPDTYYLFIVPEMADDFKGYMVRGKAVGFIENNQPAHTYAHEIAHGTFGLEHTFPAIPTGSTTNLLDYTTNHNHLSHHPWLEIQNFNPVFSILDDEEDGGAITVYTNDYSEIFELSNPDSSITFLSPSGVPITLKGAIANLTFSTFEDKWTQGDEIVESSYVPIGALGSFELNGNFYRAIRSADANFFQGYYNQENEKWFVDTLSSKIEFTPVMVLPSYTIYGFQGQAFHCNATHLNFEISDSNRASGSVLNIWDLLKYATYENIENGVDLTVTPSRELSINTRTILEGILFSNDASTSGTQTNSLEANYSFLATDIPYLNEVITKQQSFEGIDETTEKYIGYHALLIYIMAQYIEDLEPAMYCFLDLGQRSTDATVGLIAHANYEKLTNGAELTGEPNFTEYFNLNYTDKDGLTLPPLDFNVSLNAVYLPGNMAVEYKRTRLKILFEEIRMYNQLIYQFDTEQDLTYDDLMTLASQTLTPYSENLTDISDCFFKLLSVSNKKMLLDKFIQYDDYWTGDPFFEAIFVKMIENITPTQFHVMYPDFLTANCTIFDAIEDELSDELIDRFINQLSYLILEIQKSLPTYSYSDLPVLQLYKDGLNPFDSEIENTRDNCDVSFDTDLYGEFRVESDLYKLWDLIQLQVMEDFDVPSLDGHTFQPGDYMVAPAYWTHYFLEKQDEIVNDQIFSYFLSTVFTLATMGTGLPAGIIITGLGTSYTLNLLGDELELTQEQKDNFEELADQIELISVLPLFVPINYARLGLHGMPFFKIVFAGGGKVISFAFHEVYNLLRLISLNPRYALLIA